MKLTIFRGLKIRIENEAGSIRKGVDKATGEKWEVEMKYSYGEIIGSMGVDGDPVDCFIGDNKSAKFVYVIHQLNKHNGTFDEDKCMLGFDDAMDAKAAYNKCFDKPDHFYGTLETIPLAVFKKKVMETKQNPQMIHASKLNTTLALYADGEKVGKGTPVTVDGFHGRGVVIGREGNRVKIRFRNGLYISRDLMYVHPMSDNTVSKMWRT